MNITAIIVDDEPLARSRMQRFLEAEGKINVLAQATNGKEAVQLVNEHKPDIVFMDVEMPVLNGIEAAKEIINQRARPPAIIFCTAYDQYAVEAFKTQAVGYLLKPVSVEELNKAILSARRVSKLQIQNILEGLDQGQNITIQQNGFLSKLPIDEVIYFRAEDKQVIAGKGDNEVIVDYTMKMLEQKLLNDFIRVHRNALVNRQYIVSLYQDESGQNCIKLKNDNHIFPVSRRHLSAIRKLFKSEL